MNIQDLDKTYIANTYARFPLCLVRGKGSMVYDENGKEYIDLSTGIAVNTFGFGDDIWIEAINKQMAKLQHTSNLYYTEPCVRLAQMLCDSTGFKKVFFSNSGAEANECAIKVARKYSADKYGAQRHKIITLEGSFHGRTISTLSATGQEVFHKDFLPLTPGFVHIKTEVEALKNAIDKDVAAIMIEPIQGESGVMPLSSEFIQAAADIAKDQDILLIVDEVQTGNGRTGKLFAYMHHGIMPDILSTAKGLAGGLPLGATLMGQKVENTLAPGSHGSTFGGNPISCAGAISILSRIDEELLKSIVLKHNYIVEELSKSSGVKSISGMGFMLGIETIKDANEVLKTCMDNGLLVIKAKNKIRLLPALNIGWDELRKAVEVLGLACEG